MSATTTVQAPDASTVRKFWLCHALINSPVAGEAQNARVMSQRIAGGAGLTVEQFKVRYPDPNEAARKPKFQPRPAQQAQPKPAPQAQAKQAQAEPKPENPFASRVRDAKQRAALLKALKEQQQHLSGRLEELKQERIASRKANATDAEEIERAKATIRNLNARIRQRENNMQTRERRIKLSQNESLGIKNTLAQIAEQLASMSVKKAFNGLFDSVFK